ncbi:hypothetical protein LINPERPRIM_LOCUS6717 [Linum perenne]
MDDGRNTNVTHRPSISSTGGVEDLNENHIKKDSIDVDGSVNSSNAHSSPSRPPLTPTSVASAGSGYDPKRIPSEIFTSKSGNGIEWSTNSNESLFSIYMGNNNSLSKDQIAMINKSGELVLMDQDNNNNQQPRLPPSSPISAPIQRNMANPPLTNTSSSNDDNVPAPPPEIVPPPPATMVGLNRNSMACSSTTTNRNSTSSTNSFQFPILHQDKMGRNSTRKVEAEQIKFTEKKAATLQEEKEEVVEEETTTTTTTKEDKKEETEEKVKQEEEKDETVENQEEKTTGAADTEGGGRSSSWLSCFPCFSKSAAPTSS